jgi:cytochrome c-type biogenesis protein CcmF
MAGEAPPVALVALVRRNRRRYGGYIVHIGIAVLFVGVAASSSFQHASELGLSPGQSARVGAYTVRYVRPTASVTPDYDSADTPAGRELSAVIRSQRGVTLGPDTARTGATLSLGAVLDVSKGGRHVTTLYPSEGYYASEEPTQGSVGHLIGGQPVSHVALNAGVTRDVWTAIAPNIETPRLKRIIALGNKTLPYIHPEEGIVAIAAMASAYMQNPPQAQFHLIVSPLVMWIWIGGLIVGGGALVAIWPVGSAMRRRVSVRGGASSALEAAREAKYREIRDAELDYRSGKLSREDYEAVDATLRAEAITILDRLQPVERVEKSEEGESEERELTPTGA